MNCKSCKGDLGIENVELMRKGMRTTCPRLYVLPKKAETLHDTFVESMKTKRWNFILVSGDNGDGKSVYIKFLEYSADELGYPIVHIEIKDDQIAQYGPGPYFTLQIFNNLRLPDGELLSWKILQNERTRKKVHQILEKDLATFEFWSPALTSALLHVTNDSNEVLKKMSLSWLKGEPKYVTELREMGIYDKTMKSLLNVPTDRALYLLKDLLNNLGYKGLIVSVDEIERVADLNRPKSIPTLSVLRDIINILTSHDSMPTKRGITQGLFVVYAISTFFLGYSGVIERSGVDFAAQADRYGRPKVTLMDVPRLGTVLKNSASQIDISFDSMTDLGNLAEKIITCYGQAMKKTITIDPRELAKESFEKTNTFLARMNVMAMIKTLDKL
ncbi:MAG: hypothetical protein DDT42_01498 [candidate division WS2 bacterium]|uniref:ATP-binding protein n=1 Tax=Psychracetigena formicireducens TaxID=2986056 RepID=A0A9E2BIC9_PSYF1|nr:hypothetical protein [Candidatus Psychracetigena formicireducens]